MADGSGGFSSHLVTPESTKPKTTTHLADICKTADLDEKRVLLELGPEKAENVSTPTRAFELADSGTILILKKLTFPKPSENT